MKYENFEVLWEEVGFTYVEAVVYEPIANPNFWQRFFRITKKEVFRIVCTLGNGFPKRLFRYNMSTLNDEDYRKLVVIPAIMRYNKHLNSLAK